jgi:uncharacterized protein YutE (UPF0331/DUF86 family)
MDEKIERQLELIDTYFERLEKVNEEDEGVLKEESMENLVRKIVSSTIDIASRIIALEGGGRPDNYADYFNELNERGVIEENLSRKLEEMARFRNFIVHRYRHVDQEQLEEIIDKSLGDVRELIRQVEEYSKDR